MTKEVDKKQSTGMFETVTGTFKKFTFHGSAEDSHSGSHLALMNIPHWLAKRDAAYEGAVYLVKNNLVSKAEEQRQYTYTRILALLNLASKAHYRVQASLVENDKQPKDQVDYIGEYFKLLTNLVNAASSLLDVDIIMSSEADNSISSFVGQQGAENLNVISLTCMEDEKKLHESIMNLILTVEKLFKKEDNRSKKTLSKIDRNRYDEAFEELQNIYKQIAIEEGSVG